jgi:hypothetical protein
MDGTKVGRQTQAPVGTAGAQQGGGGTGDVAGVGQGGVQRRDGMADAQYDQAGNQTGQGQTGRGLAHAMEENSGVNKGAASGGVYEGGRPL